MSPVIVTFLHFLLTCFQFLLARGSVRGTFSNTEDADRDGKLPTILLLQHSWTTIETSNGQKVSPVLITVVSSKNGSSCLKERSLYNNQLQ